MTAKNKNTYILYGIGGAFYLALILIIVLIIRPTIQFGFYDLPFAFFLLFSSVAFFAFIIHQIMLDKLDFHESQDEKYLLIKQKVFIISLILSGIMLIFLTMLPLLTSLPMFGNADNYKSLIGEVKDKNFDTSKLKVSLQHIRIIDENNAKILGDKKLGEDLGLGSRVEIGKYNIQKVQNELFWVAPLEYRSFFKWLNDDDGIEGYIMVSAQNSKDVRLITEVNGKKLHLKYMQSASGFEYIKRYLYFKGYFNIGLTDYTFEVDDNLNPYYVITKYEKTVGYEGENAIGVIVVDVQTGDIKDYSMNNIPEWIDRIQPEDFITTQLNDWGKYIHGWWNSKGFSEQKEVTKLTDGQKLVYANDGNSYWYSGVTSVGSDDSIIGFLLSNSRTKETFFYKQSGATEKAAMRSAQGKVQEKGYYATFPSLYQIAGIPTYVLTLKDKEGLVKLFAMVSVEKYEIVGTGTTLKSALRDYKSMLYSQGNNLGKEDSNKLDTLSGIVSRISTDIRDGYSYYYIMLENNKFIFVGNSNVSDELPITKEGDNISIKFRKQSETIKVVDLLNFDNLQI